MMLTNQNVIDKQRQVVKYGQYYLGWQTTVKPSAGKEGTGV